MAVTNVYDLEREAMLSQYKGGRYRQSRRRSKSRASITDNGPRMSYARESGARFNSRSRSASAGRSASRRRSASRASSFGNQSWKNPKALLSNFVNQLKGGYNQKIMSNVDAYVRKTVENAVEMNNVNFLMRCASQRLIPMEYWVDVSKVRRTREVLRFLEQCASRLMLEDIRMHKKATVTLSKSISEIKDHLKLQLSARDFSRLQKLLDAHYQNMFDAIRQRQRDAFEKLQRMAYNDSGNQKSQKQSSPSKPSGGHGRRGKQRGQSASDGKSRSGSDASSPQAE